MELSYIHAVILGVVEGLTEFLPVSSTGHLTLAEKLLGLQIDNPTVTGYTATIQIGAIVATFVYFFRDIARLVVAFVAGLRSREQRGHDYQLAWAVVVGSIPVGVVGFFARGVIEGPLRSLWVVAAALVGWSAVMWWAERRHDGLVAADSQRGEGAVGVRDGLILGLVQCCSLVPGVSRSGATISAGLARGIDRVTATRLSFFMAIPALTAAGLFGLRDVDSSVIGWGQMAVGIAVAFVVAYASIAWLLRFVAHHRITWFVPYRIALGVVMGVALGAGWVSAT